MTNPFSLEQKLAHIFSGYISTAEAVTYGLPSLDLAPRRVPQDGDTEAPETRLEVSAKRDATGSTSSTIKVEFFLYVPQDILSREAAETQMAKLRQYLFESALADYIDELDESLASGWAFASGIRDDAVTIDMMEERLERAFTCAVSFDVANDPGS